MFRLMTLNKTNTPVVKTTVTYCSSATKSYVPSENDSEESYLDKMSFKLAYGDLWEQFYNAMLDSFNVTQNQSPSKQQDNKPNVEYTNEEDDYFYNLSMKHVYGDEYIKD